jgi:hypothetical protein
MKEEEEKERGCFGWSRRHLFGRRLRTLKDRTNKLAVVRPLIQF